MSESGTGDGRADSIRHSFCSHLVLPRGNFHVAALLSRTPLLAGWFASLIYPCPVIRIAKCVNAKVNLIPYDACRFNFHP
jgi:hypothetical protein